MKTQFAKEVMAAGLPHRIRPEVRVMESDLAGLPEPARRYMRFMGVVGRPRDWSFRLGWKGRFRSRLDGPWMACEAWQYNSSIEVARVFHMRLRLGGVVPAIGRDVYLGGRGRMLVRMLDLFTVADAAGLELDLGELVTWLDDAVFFAPSMLLSPAVGWTVIDRSSFDLVLTDRGHTVGARVLVDERGAPLEFATTDRWCEDPSERGHLIRARWTTPLAGWELIDGRRVPTSGRAIWHLPQGAIPYAEFRMIPDSLVYNTPPGY